jgi:hypothetical protein
MNEKLDEILKDEAVVNELCQQKTAEDVQKFIASKGIEISTEDSEAILKEIIARNNGEEDLNDEQLEKVSGGGFLMKIIKPKFRK